MRDLRQDLATFAQAQLASGDIDPAYPVLRALEAGCDPGDRLTFTLLYLHYYDLDSAWRAWTDPTADRLALPTGTERRAHRDRRQAEAHFEDEAKIIAGHGGIEEWLRAPQGTPPTEAWEHTAGRYREGYGNGRWASYKLCEVLKEVHGWPLSAPDMGNYGSSGPLAGLALVTGAPFNPGRRDQAAADQAAEDLRGDLAARGVDVPIEQLETLLCDFHAMAEGRYYPGHDIDLMAEQAARRPGSPIWQARRVAFQEEWLGEVQGWKGRSTRRAQAYRRTGVVWTDPLDGPR